jgi:sterol desaturase/sphingolipid hydroxylase (fatty acid hydroxylase superfamily)
MSLSLEQVRIYSTFAIILCSFIIILLERLFPYEKNQRFFREGFIDDFILYTLVQSYILGIIISYIIQFIDGQTNLSRLHLLSGWPIWVQLIFFLVVHDFYIYWFHRYQHSSRIFWRIHEAHHSNKNIDWLAGSRSHALEILINQSIEFAPIILLGAAPEIAILKGLIDAVWGMYIHSNIDINTGRLQYFINGPEMHRWHHADKDEKAYNKNFSTKLAIWDWIFRTAYFPKDQKPKAYGLSYLNFPKHYFKQLLFAFRKFENE